MYEYVVDIKLKTDTWDAIKRGVATKSIKTHISVGDGEGDGDGDNRNNCNRTLLLGGRKDGYICVFNWKTGQVDFKIDVSLSYSVLENEILHICSQWSLCLHGQPFVWAVQYEIFLFQYGRYPTSYIL